ncbi:MAG: choice-of-anchor I family protein [Acidimicrobiales bacterium]
MRRTVGVVLGAVTTVAALGVGAVVEASPERTAALRFVASFDSGAGEAGAEIVAFDRRTKTMLVTNGAATRIDIVSIADPAAPTLLRSVDLLPYGPDVQSVAAHGGMGVAVVSGATVLDPGSAVFFSIESGRVLGTAPTGVLPDSVTWSEDGRRVVIANEGEPRCVTGPDRQPTTDPLLAENPEGSITVIDVGGRGAAMRARQIDFKAFNGQQDQLQAAGIRVGTWPGASVAQDLEPEYATIVGDKAYVTLQENNALAIVDLRKGTVKDLVALGAKDHGIAGNELDASDRDGAYRPSTWPVQGLYLPDTIASMSARGRTYLLTANEGDTRTYFAGLDNEEVEGNECFADEGRVRSLPGGLDPAAFGGADAVTSLRDNANLGRLKVSTVFPSVSGAAGYRELYAFGGRSFSIWDDSGRLVWDSGSLLEATVALVDPGNWPTTVSGRALGHRLLRHPQR